MRLYHHPFSSNARKPVLTALELGAPVDLVMVDLAKGAQREPAFLAKNPNGKVPVLDDDGFLLWESHAIMQYLADKTPGQTLYPTDTRARADVNRWLFWCNSHFMPGVGVLNWENMIKPMVNAGPADPVEVKRGEKLLTDSGKILDDHLAGKEWVCQDRLTLADLALAAPLMSTEAGKLPVKGFAHLQRWFAKIQERPSWKKTSL